MRKILLFLAVAVCLPLNGCAQKYMTKVEPTEEQHALKENEAAIVFVRIAGGAVYAPIAEGIDGKVNFVTVLSSGVKHFHKTTPGKHFYVVGGYRYHLLEADLEGGKTYYVHVAYRSGGWKSNFIFEPVTREEAMQKPKATVFSSTDVERQDDELFIRRFERCDWYENKPQGEAWFAGNKESMLQKFIMAKADHETGERKRAILSPDDGLVVPLR